MRLIACVSFLFVVLAGARPDNYGGPFILAPPSVEAGTSFEARVVNMEISGGNTTYCHAFRIYLASTPLETDYYRSYIKDCTNQVHQPHNELALTGPSQVICFASRHCAIPKSRKEKITSHLDTQIHPSMSPFRKTSARRGHTIC
jgi:hypothetical protein